MAHEAIRVARELRCDVILHTANQSQNTLRRLNGALEQLGFEGYYGTPYEFSALTREEKARGLHKRGVDVFKTRNYSGDSNLWCREFESGMLDDPEQFSTPEALYLWSASTPKASATRMSITFSKGVPVEVDGKAMPILELIAHLNVKAGAYGLGRFSGLEHLSGGEKVLEVREMPAAHVLLGAYRQLETACVDAEAIREKISQEQLWVREALEGRWFGALRTASGAFIDECARRVNGTVRWRAVHGVLGTTSIRADDPLYIRDREAWEGEQIHQDLNRCRALAGL